MANRRIVVSALLVLGVLLSSASSGPGALAAPNNQQPDADWIACDAITTMLTDLFCKPKGPKNTPTPAATNTPIATATPAASPTATEVPATATPQNTNTPVPSPSPTESPSATDTPAPTATDVPPTATATSTNTPMPPTSTPVDPTPTTAPPTATPQTLGVILNKYDYKYDQLERGIQGNTKYLPRQFVNGLTIPDVSWGQFVVSNAASYAGWDVLYTTNTNNWRTWTDPEYLRLTLNRPGTVGLVWRGKGSNPPAWLTQQGWTEGAPISTTGSGGNQFGSHRVFTKQMPAGEWWVPGVNVGAPAGVSNNTWWVLFGESNGTASAPPFVAGEREVPVPNATCPAWVHDQYVALGPDGKLYRTWHRVIDPVYWCYFGHEHGDDPSLLGVPGFTPLFARAAEAEGAVEFHQGFKGLAWKDTDNNFTHYDVMHFGTSNTNSVCNRFHEMTHAGARDGTLLFHVQYQADFGTAQQNNTNDVFYLVTKPQCSPNGSGPTPGSHGQRQMPVQSSDIGGSPSPNPTFYEPWRIDVRATLGILGVYMYDFVVNNPDPMVICANRSCASDVVTGFPGAQRFWLTQPDSNVRKPAHADANGYFYTNSRGTAVAQPGDGGSVRQFVNANLDMRDMVNSEECAAKSIWGTELSTCTLGSNHGAVRNPEKSITTGPN